MLGHAAIYDFIKQNKLGTLATMADGRQPQSALVGIAVTPDLELVFDTLESSRKYRNLLTNPACSFVIGWSGERTVQYEGTSSLLRLPERQRYLETYFQVWPECRAHLSWPGIVHFLVKPHWIRYSDFDQSPPLVEEFRFKAAASNREPLEPLD